MKLSSHFIICISLVFLPQVVFAGTKGNDSYSDKELKQINYILIMKKACDLHIPEYYLNNIQVYANWRKKHSPIIQEMENHPAYIKELEAFRNKLKLMTPQQIRETLMECKKITDRLNESSKMGSQ